MYQFESALGAKQINGRFLNEIGQFILHAPTGKISKIL